MLRPPPVRRLGFVFALASGAALCPSASAQTKLPSALPPTPATGAPAAQIAPLNATAAKSDAVARAQRADVKYAAGLISVNANNSSLNQILREIARQTGMKITGGVRDERVFGHYGPASPEIILATLIDGNSTNMVIRETASNTPAELILTPRAGGPSPPNPNAAGFDDGDDDHDGRNSNLVTPQQRVPQSFGRSRQVPLQNSAPRPFVPNPGSVPPSIPQPANNVNGSPFNTSPTAATLPVTNSVPTDSLPTPSVTPPANGIVDAPNPPDPGAINPVTPNPPVDPNPPASPDTTTPTDPNSPNGVKTPEQIFQQLQQLQQQRQQQQNSTITPQ